MLVFISICVNNLSEITNIAFDNSDIQICFILFTINYFHYDVIAILWDFLILLVWSLNNFDLFNPVMTLIILHVCLLESFSSKFYRLMLSIIKSSFNLSLRNFLFQINSKYIDYLVVFTVAFFGSYHKLYLFLHNVNSWCYQWAV